MRRRARRRRHVGHDSALLRIRRCREHWQKSRLTTIPTGGDSDEHRSERARHHRPDPRLLGHARAAGRTGSPTTSQRASGCSRPPTPASRSRSRRSTPTRRPIEARRPCRRSSSTSSPSSAGSTRRPSSWGTRPAGRSPRSCSTTASAPPAWRSNSAPTEGVKVVPLSQVKATFPVLKNPANRHRAVGLTLEQWHYAFTNTFTEEESRALYERYAIPASGPHLLGQRARELPARATTTPGSTTTTTTAPRCCSSRAPRTTSCRRRSSSRTPSTTRSDDGHRGQGVRRARTCCRRATAGRRSPTTPSTGRSRTPPRASTSTPSGRGAASRLTHIGGPTVLIEVDGWRLLTDPTFDPPGPHVPLRLGHRRRASSTGPGARRRRPRPDRRGAAHPRPPRRQPRRRRPRAAAVGADVVTTAAGAARLGGDARGLEPWAYDAAGGAGAADDRDHRDAVPTRPAAEPSARRRRHRVRAAVGRSGARCAVDLGRHRALRRSAGGRRPGRGRRRRSCTSAACSSRSPDRSATR